MRERGRYESGGGERGREERGKKGRKELNEMSSYLCIGSCSDPFFNFNDHCDIGGIFNPDGWYEINIKKGKTSLSSSFFFLPLSFTALSLSPLPPPLSSLCPL
jgi:hypothetical protein